ncbi:MAG: hypothetical protein UX75_C0002G0003 [Candidatus Moranbacteria bacterium GW2011_GWE2_47_10]|nr:MAG: hypothetical protein UX75_C0002G0003 [Candidatus Moranbacteria bacterium GW2011_GWE2_47_10]HBP00691.1 hypothetical protein [Candidatus Moranbacteria bacterium]
MDKDWAKVRKVKVGDEVMLCRYRKARGDGFMDEERLGLVGKTGRVAGIDPEGKDLSGCKIARIDIGDEKIVFWRIANLKARKSR